MLKEPECNFSENVLNVFPNPGPASSAGSSPVLVWPEAANEVQAMHIFQLSEQGVEFSSMSFTHLGNSE